MAQATRSSSKGTSSNMPNAAVSKKMFNNFLDTLDITTTQTSTKGKVAAKMSNSTNAIKISNTNTAAN